MLLSIKNLRVKFGENVIVENVSFEVKKGDILAVIGPNGSGKTTLLKAILELIPSEGEIKWGGKPKIGYVPQRFEFDRTLPITVQEIFLLRTKQNFWIRRKSNYKQVINVLAQVGAEKLIDKRVGELSGGELQRVLIAYSLIGNPDIIFFDEPITGIDVGGEETVYHLIHYLAHKIGITIVLISHDLHVVYQHATQVVCLNRNMVCYGVPEKVLTSKMIGELYGKHTVIYEHKHKSERH